MTQNRLRIILRSPISLAPNPTLSNIVHDKGNDVSQPLGKDICLFGARLHCNYRTSARQPSASAPRPTVNKARRTSRFQHCHNFKYTLRGSIPSTTLFHSGCVAMESLTSQDDHTVPDGPENYQFPMGRFKEVMDDSSKTPLVLVACGSFSP